MLREMEHRPEGLAAAARHRGRSLHRPAGLLLDMDGTLVDTEPLWFAAERAAVASFGGHLPDEAADELLGLDTTSLIAQLIDRYGAATDPVTLGRAIVEELGSLLGTAAPLPGAPELVEAALTAGLRLVVVSNSPARVVEATLAPHAWARGLRVRVTADDAVRPKPAPDLYHVGLDRLGLGAEGVVAIEDSPVGATAAVAAGLRCIGVASRLAPPEDLLALTPYVVRDLHEAAVWLGLADAGHPPD